MASEKVLKLVEDVKTLTVLELSELVKTLEEEFGVSAAAPVAVAAPVAGAAAPVEVEQTEFDVVLTDFGQTKMNVIKLAKEITGLNLKEAKELVEAAPKAVIKSAVSRADADALKARFEEAGAKVEIK
ncbi:MAG: 50S ribosomal protein L7/L12 [Oscillospiraceae bacterium]|jgi:large subunit ribosomal protein L7/L12|nr:50S ribosomal protein L7/L12 [Oscillospiraceae bacterium]